MNQKAANFKSGFVGLVGPTNAGKSTLLNALLGEKISIVSAKPQTTYHRIRGILTTSDYQIVFTDLPGFQNRRENVHKMLNDVADRNSKECDIVCFVFDVSDNHFEEQFQSLEEKMKEATTKQTLFLVLNKIDNVDKKILLPILDRMNKTGYFKELVPISARREFGTKELVKTILSYLPEGPAYYDAGTKTDRAQAFQFSEIIREKIYQFAHEEIPYRVRVEMEQSAPEPSPEEPPLSCPHFYATIHVDSPSRKAILIGKQGQMLKQIGSKARADIEKTTGKKIFLKLHVDVEKEWLLDKNKVEKYLELT